MSCRVVHLTSVHHVFDTRIFHKECKSLASAGYDVTLIAPHTEGHLIRDGVRVKAVSSPSNRRERMTRTIWGVYQSALAEDAAVYHFHDPELMPIGALLKMHGKRVICDVHEDYSGSMSGKQWLPRQLHGPAAWGVSLCESVLAQSYDCVVAATPTIAAKFEPRKRDWCRTFPGRTSSAPSWKLPMKNEKQSRLMWDGLRTREARGR